MQTKEFLGKVCEQIKYKPIRSEISEELENHIQELKESYIQEGIQEDEAEEKAITQMGQAEEIGKRLNKIHKPKMNLQLLMLTLILLGFGFLLTHIDNADAWKSNLIYISISIIPFLLIYFFDYKKLQKHSYLIYCIATIVLLGPIIAGDTTWSTRSVTRIIAMPLYIISFVGFIENISKKGEIKIEYIKTYNINIKIVIAVLSVISLIIMLQYSRSLMWLLLLTYYTIVTSKVIQTKNKGYIKKLLKITGISIIIATVVWTVNFFNHYDEAMYEITTRLNNISGVGFESILQKDVTRSAKLIGKADNLDIKTVLLYNAEKGIFTLMAILINYGWIISILMITMVLSFSIKLIRDVTKIKDMYGKLLIIGIASSFIFRSIVCIIINLNAGLLSINSGIPFISYGKVNLLIDILSLAVIFSVYRRKNITLNLSKESINVMEAN